MVAVIVFTEQSSAPAYEALASKHVRIEYVPLGQVTAIDDNAVELAVIDCGHDAANGLSLLTDIKQRRPDVPVIFVTDAHSVDVVLQAFKMGAREYFHKPLQPEELATAVEKILRFKRYAPERSHSPVAETSLPSLFSLSPILPGRLQRVIEHIEQNLSSALCLDELSRHACMSKFHFCRLFKRHVGMSPKQYCICRKMEHARQLLRRPDQTVTQTAFLVGFNDTTEFIRQFKKFTGLTPRVFRNSRPSMLTAR